MIVSTYKPARLDISEKEMPSSGKVQRKTLGQTESLHKEGSATVMCQIWCGGCWSGEIKKYLPCAESTIGGSDIL
jgi:hypothetical protein